MKELVWRLKFEGSVAWWSGGGSGFNCWKWWRFFRLRRWSIEVEVQGIHTSSSLHLIFKKCCSIKYHNFSKRKEKQDHRPRSGLMEESLSWLSICIQQVRLLMMICIIVLIKTDIFFGIIIIVQISNMGFCFFGQMNRWINLLRRSK